MDWFLYNTGLRHERVKKPKVLWSPQKTLEKKQFLEKWYYLEKTKRGK